MACAPARRRNSLILNDLRRQKKVKINAKKCCAFSEMVHTTSMTETFPATAAEYEEYCAVMDALAAEAEASTPDPLPVHLGRADFVPASEIIPAGFSTVRSVRL